MKYLNDVSYKDCAGKVCKSTSSGDFKILKYNNAKEAFVKEQANKFKSQIDPRAYNALMNYEVSSDD